MSMSDDIQDGVFCQECMCLIDGNFREPCWYPRYCESCGGDPACNGARKIPRTPVRNRLKESKKNKTEQG